MFPTYAIMMVVSSVFPHEGMSSFSIIYYSTIITAEINTVGMKKAGAKTRPSQPQPGQVRYVFLTNHMV